MGVTSYGSFWREDINRKFASGSETKIQTQNGVMVQIHSESAVKDPLHCEWS